MALRECSSEGLPPLSKFSHFPLFIFFIFYKENSWNGGERVNTLTLTHLICILFVLSFFSTPRCWWKYSSRDQRGRIHPERSENGEFSQFRMQDTNGLLVLLLVLCIGICKDANFMHTQQRKLMRCRRIKKVNEKWEQLVGLVERMKRKEKRFHPFKLWWPHCGRFDFLCFMLVIRKSICAVW